MSRFGGEKMIILPLEQEAHGSVRKSVKIALLLKITWGAHHQKSSRIWMKICYFWGERRGKKNALFIDKHRRGFGGSSVTEGPSAFVIKLRVSTLLASSRAGIISQPGNIKRWALFSLSSDITALIKQLSHKRPEGERIMGKQYPRLGISPLRSGPASLGQRCIMPRHTQLGWLRLEDGVRGGDFRACPWWEQNGNYLSRSLSGMEKQRV